MINDFIHSRIYLFAGKVLHKPENTVSFIIATFCTKNFAGTHSRWCYIIRSDTQWAIYCSWNKTKYPLSEY